VITTALKHGKAEQRWIDTAITSMTTLNRTAALVATRDDFEVHAMTDVTGFGLMGHGRELAVGSGVSLHIEVEAVPLIEGARDAVRLGTIPAGLLANREFAACFVAEASGTRLEEDLITLMYDPQTSGGLLIAVAETHAGPLLDALREERVAAAQIGRVSDGKPRIELR
jgi:selenide, water dikinase